MVLPLAFQNLMSALVSASDAVMLGFLEQEALSAVSLAAQVTFVFNICVTVLVQGTTMLAAQYWGKGDLDTVEKILALAMRYMAFVSVAFALGCLTVPGQLMSVLTNEDALIFRGASYLRIAGLSYLPSGLSQIYLCIMKNSGKTAKSTVIGSSAMILNLLLNAVLIYGYLGLPAMGIRGAALATLISLSIQFVWTILEERKPESVKIHVSGLVKSDAVIRKDFWHYTLPVVGNYFFYGGGVTMFSVIIGHLGNDAVAAYSMANIVNNTMTCVAKGIGVAGAILVGNELGRQNIDRAKLYAKHATILSAGLGTVTCGLLLLLRPVILNFATLTPEAMQYLSGMLFICSYCMIVSAINSLVIGGIFCAGGKSKFGMIADGVSLWLIIIPLSSIAAFIWELPVVTVYFIIQMAEWIKLPFVIWYYRKYSWAQNLTK